MDLSSKTDCIQRIFWNQKNDHILPTPLFIRFFSYFRMSFAQTNGWQNFTKNIGLLDPFSHNKSTNKPQECTARFTSNIVSFLAVQESSIGDLEG